MISTGSILSSSPASPCTAVLFRVFLPEPFDQSFRRGENEFALFPRQGSVELCFIGQDATTNVYIPALIR